MRLLRKPQFRLKLPDFSYSSVKMLKNSPTILQNFSRRFAQNQKLSPRKQVPEEVYFYRRTKVNEISLVSCGGVLYPKQVWERGITEATPLFLFFPHTPA
jgi:hypothetical protein